MSRPNFENIDRWFFEYTEGNLSDIQEAELMDFLNLHPELEAELNAWKKAKVQAPEHEEIATDRFLRPVPFFLRPITLISIALLTLGLGWFAVSLYPATPLYSKAKIDAEIIEANSEQSEDIFDKRLAERDKAKEEKTAGVLKTIKSKSTLSKNNSSTPIQEVKNAKLQKTPVLEKDQQNTTEIVSTSNSASLALENIEIKSTSPQKTEAEDLATISNYLTEKENPRDQQIHFDDEKNIARKDQRSRSSSYSSKSSLSKSINTAIRKIKRMAEYPVALQNTTNPHFHTPMKTGYKANPAMVGTAPGNRIQVTSRMQWPNEPNAQLLNSISWDSYIYAIRGGLGIDVNYNNYDANGINSYSASITYSPKFSINKDISFEPALRFKMGAINLNKDADIIGNPIEVDRKNIIPLFVDQEEINGQQMLYRDLEIGFMLNTKSFYLGASADNLGRHSNNFYSNDLSKEYRSDMYYTAIIGTEYAARTKDIKLNGYGLYQNFGSLNELWLGTNFQYKWMEVGVAASSNLDMAGSVGAVFNKFSIHYNADLTESRLLDKQLLSHQVTMKILLKPNRYAAKFLKL